KGASNRKIAAQTCEAALATLRHPDWHDFGPTFAAEQLSKLYRIEVGKETLRGWMIEAGLWEAGSTQTRASTNRATNSAVTKTGRAHAWKANRPGDRKGRCRCQSRSAVTGSRRKVRSAGRTQAASTANTSNATTPPMVKGSQGVTLKSSERTSLEN